MKKISLIAFAATALSSAFADVTFNVPSGTTVTTNGMNETGTSRVTKSGAGTLVINGANSLKRMTVSAGTVRFSGGTTTIADSAATGAYSDALFVQNAGETIIENRATVIAKDGKYFDINNGSFTVTNATFDATGMREYVMNSFSGNNSDCWININSGGVMRVRNIRPTGTDNAAMKDRTGIRLNKDGHLYLNYFWIDGKTANRYGRICFDGGVLHPTGPDGTQIFQSNSSPVTDAYGWAQDQTTPTILEGGCYINTVSNSPIYKSFSGIPQGGKDGGLHHLGTGVLYWRGGASTFNGGLWLESTQGGVFSIGGDYGGDSTLGEIPATPSTNIWVMGSNHTIFNEGTVNIHTNRMVFIKDGNRMYAGSQGRLAFHGEIHGEIAEGKTEPTGTVLHVKNGGSWNGTIALDPGAGHTNDIGRLINEGRLEITSGVVRVTTESQTPWSNGSLVYVGGNGSSKNNYRGHLIINGGTLTTVPQAEGLLRYMTAINYADVEITNGGKIDAPKACYVNGLQSPASITIADGGEMKVVGFQFANATANCTVDLKSGGRLISNEFWCNEGGGCNVNIDGGVIGTQGNKDHVALGLDGGAARWTGVNIFVKEGGVTFEVPTSGKVLWLRHPLQSAAESDAGLRKTGSGILVVETNCVFHGSTTVSGGSMQVRGNNFLPQTTLKLENRATAAFSLYNGSDYTQYTHTEQTFKRIEGNGTVGYSKNVHVTEALAPSVDGVLTFEWACDLNGDFEIQGNSNTCSRIYSQRDILDLTKLTLKVADFSTFDTSKAKFNSSTGTGYYRIFTCNAGGRSGEFNLPADWPGNWEVKYTSTGAYLRYLKGTKFVIR